MALDRKNNSQLPYVSTNNFEAAKLGASYLIERGATNLLCLSGPQNAGTFTERAKGFEAAMTDNVSYRIVEGDLRYQYAFESTKEALAQDRTIDGVFACSDYAALGALKAIQEAGLRVPEDVQVVGYDGIELGDMVLPGLTTVAQPVYGLGETATRMLISKLEDKEIQQTRVVLEASLCVRGTTK